MPRLGDLVGSLMTEFTLARVRADLESVKLVELYRKEGLLEGASVPRFRMPDVTVDLPLLVSELESGDSTSGFNRPTAVDVRESIREAAASTRFKLDANMEEEIVKQLDVELDAMWKTPQPLDAALLLARDAALKLDPMVRKRVASRPSMRDALSAPRPRELDPKLSAEDLDAETRTFLRSVELRLKTKAIGSIGQGPRFIMSAKTSEIRETGDPSLVARVSMTFKEDGFEVVSVESGDGVSQVRLVPE